MSGIDNAKRNFVGQINFNQAVSEFVYVDLVDNNYANGTYKLCN